ncbi:MAG: hypothetical protein U1D30_12430 [Planctomycetota bacterium]
MPATQFDRNALVEWYAREHLKTDPGILAVHFLPAGADEREIRLIEVNQLMGERTDDSLEPIDFGVDSGTETAHRLLVLDVTPDQWRRITSQQLRLPSNWSLKGSIEFANE